MKKISVKVVIDKIFRDLNLQNSDWTDDAIEWVAEAIEFIGHKTGFISKEKSIKIVSHRGILPNDYYIVQPKGVIYKGASMYYGSNSDIYNPEESEILLANTSQTFQSLDRARYGHPVIPDYRENSSRYYELSNDGYIITSIENGEILLKYYAYPTDKDGYLLIPDDVYYKEAILWYVLKKLILGGYRHPEFNYHTANQYWKKSCAAAANNAAYPTFDKMVSFTKNWVRMIPKSPNEF